MKYCKQSVNSCKNAPFDWVRRNRRLKNDRLCAIIPTIGRDIALLILILNKKGSFAELALFIENHYEKFYATRIIDMEKREQYKRMLMFCTSVVLLVLMTGAFAYIWFAHYADHEVIGIDFYHRGNYVVIVLYAVILLLFCKLFGALKIGRMRAFEGIVSQGLAVLSTNIFAYLQLCLIGNWRFLTNMKPMLWATVADMAVAVVWVLVTRWIYVKLFPPRKLLAVYGSYSPNDLLRKLAARGDKYTIGETISIDRDIEEIKEKIRCYRNVILMDIPDEIRNKLLKYCFEQDVRCYSVPKISDIMIKSAHDVHILDTALLLFRNNGLTVGQSMVKRLFDIVAAAVALVVLSPVMLVIALAIKLCDGGPVLFTQDRLTKDGMVFKIYKFRSLRVNSQSEEYCLTRKRDHRITPVGKIIRATHLDELPQIFNILKGEMSIVGPRPECPSLAEEYGQIIPEFHYRLKVKAGLTGYAQVYGKYNTTPYDKLKLDLTYIKNYSVWLDLKLILLTVKILFQKGSTEGIEAWQTTAATKENLEKIGKA